MRFLPLLFVVLISQPATAPSVDALIGDLSSPEWRVRQTAEDALSGMGSSVIPRLQQLIKESDNEEAKQRAQSALDRIGEQQQIGASLITLHVSEAQARDVFADVAKQASVTLSPMPPELWDMRPMPKVTLDVEGQPFWRVMRMLAEQTGVELRAWSDGQPRLVLGGGGGLNASQRWIVSGPFLIALVRCARTHSVDYAAGDALSSEFGISFVATAEPKLHVSRAAYFAHLDEATDDRGHSLIPTDNANEPARFFDAPGAALAGSSGSWQFNARLSYPTDMGSKLTTLRGSVGAMLQTKFETIEIGDLMSAQNVQRSAGGVTVTIESVKKNGDRYDLAMKVSREAAINVGVELERMQQSFSDIRLLDANGRPLFRTGFSSSGIGAAANGSVQEIAATMSFMAGETPLAGPDRRVSEPSKFVWKIATESKELTIPFEFKDVPLPQ